MENVVQSEIRSGRRKRFFRWASRVLNVVGIVFILAVAWDWYRMPPPPPDVPWLSVEPATYNLGQTTSLVVSPVSFTLVNHNPSTPVHVIGVTEICGPTGCAIGSNVPLTVPPGGSATLQVMFKSGNDPTFEYPLYLFTDAPEQTEIPLKIVGETTPDPGTE